MRADARDDFAEQLQIACRPARSDESDTPVTLPPGRARLGDEPDLDRIADSDAITIGIVVVARLAASAAGVPSATMTSTLSRTNSAARSGSRSYCPSAYRYSIDDVLGPRRSRARAGRRGRPRRRARRWPVRALEARCRRGRPSRPAAPRRRAARRGHRQRGQQEAAAVHYSIT